MRIETVGEVVIHLVGGPVAAVESIAINAEEIMVDMAVEYVPVNLHEIEQGLVGSWRDIDGSRIDNLPHQPVGLGGMMTQKGNLAVQHVHARLMRGVSIRVQSGASVDEGPAEVGPGIRPVDRPVPGRDLRVADVQPTPVGAEFDEGVGTRDTVALQTQLAHIDRKSTRLTSS